MLICLCKRYTKNEQYIFLVIYNNGIKIKNKFPALNIAHIGNTPKPPHNIAKFYIPTQ